jgi:phage tail-like protein
MNKGLHHAVLFLALLSLFPLLPPNPSAFTTMAGAVQDHNWPLPKFYFSVTGLNNSTTPVSFQEVTGLDTENTLIEYRHGDSQSFYPIKMPGLGKVSNVTLRKGIFAKDSALFDWFNKIKLNTIERSVIVISLLDETNKPAMTWTLQNSFPVKVSGTDLKSQGNEVAIESIEIAYETITVTV